MEFFSEIFTYFLLFIALYLEVFLFITFFEHREKTKKAKQMVNTMDVPSVSILIPCWNESGTLRATVESLLNLEYPQDKLSLFIIDDGSTDTTWETMQVYKSHPRITLLKKENGGKHTALNYALPYVHSEMVGCLDADSFVDKNALRFIAEEFARRPELMAVTPSIKVHNPRTILELIQKVEYGLGVMVRNLIAALGAIYITPGPFSIFRREVFQTLGGYRKAHNTEDMEIAVRMQKAGMTIGNAPRAFVYTSAPQRVKDLLKQRLRWTYGFMMNAIDHKDIFFNPRYGNLGMLIFPAAVFSIVSSIYFLVSTLYRLLLSGFSQWDEVQTVGWVSSLRTNIDLFYFDANIAVLLSFVSMAGSILMLFIARKMAEGHIKIGVDIFYFLGAYPILASLWMSRAIYHVLFAKTTTWR